MDSSEKDFIGRGWQFPIEFNREKGTVELVDGEEIIRNSLDVLFKTNAGERVMHPAYGSELSYFLFASVNTSTLTYMEHVIRNAILFNEPRINVREVMITASNEEGRFDVTVVYTIAVTNNRYNYVFPFYINEATNLHRGTKSKTEINPIKEPIR